MKHTSLSGRRRWISIPKLAGFAGAAFFVFLLVLIVGVAYTPVLHVLSGDNYNIQLTFESLKQKFVQENEAAVINTLFAPDPANVSTLPEVRLTADWAGYARLNHEILLYNMGELPSKPKVNAMYKTVDGKWIRVRLGYRGANNWHHQYWKPSLQVRFRGQTLIDGASRQNLIAPEDGVGIRNWLSNELAEDWNMLTYEEHFVRVFLNNRYLGLYTRTRPLDNLLLSDEGLPDGPFYRLESGTGPLFRRKALLFHDPAAWEISGIERGVGEAYLNQLLEAVALADPIERPRGACGRWIEG